VPAWPRAPAPGPGCGTPGRAGARLRSLAGRAHVSWAWAGAAAGAATADIIAQYVATIRALRDVDPAGVLLEAVGEPIKARRPAAQRARARASISAQAHCHEGMLGGAASYGA